MLVAIDAEGGAATDLELCRARVDLGVAAETLAAVCRDPRASSAAITGAERRVAEAFAQYGRLMLAAAARELR